MSERDCRWQVLRVRFPVAHRMLHHPRTALPSRRMLAQ